MRLGLLKVEYVFHALGLDSSEMNLELNDDMNPDPHLVW